MLTCPDCSGFGIVVIDHVHYSDGSGAYNVRRPCRRCGESGQISETMADWIRRGEAMRRKRVEACVSLRKEASRRGISPVALSDMEMGRVEPIEESVP